MTALRFTKMHGLGNHYVYVDGHDQVVPDPAALARAVSEPNFGVGSDGLILILPPSADGVADVRMRMFNADGSESEMCGNGIRCVCKYAHDHGLTASRPMRVETGAGVLRLDYRLDSAGRVCEVTVDMGRPILALADVPVDPSHLEPADGVEHRLRVAGTTLDVSFVSMGNPHAVSFVSDVAAVELERIGPAIERHVAFPRRINVHVVEAVSGREVTMRTWERGSGITLACGTGASAVCVAGARTARTGRDVLAHLPGGDLRLRWDEATDHVLMTGPATEVFQGVWTRDDAVGTVAAGPPVAGRGAAASP